MASYSFIFDLRLEQATFEVREEATVEEVLREREIDHTIMLSHYGIHSVVH